jgi:hypothetical protein
LLVLHLVSGGWLAPPGRGWLAVLDPSVRLAAVFARHNINPLHKEESMSTTSPNVNTVTLVGQLAADPKLREQRGVWPYRLGL